MKMKIIFDLALLPERVLFIGTQYSNLYTAVDTPAKAAWLSIHYVYLGQGVDYICVCVFITAVPIDDDVFYFRVGGRGILEDMCYERRRAEDCVD